MFPFKVKAWNGKEFIPQSALEWDGEKFITGVWNNEETHIVSDKEEALVAYFSGVKDKNDTEIYTGSIIRYDDEDGYQGIGIVLFSGGQFYLSGFYNPHQDNPYDIFENHRYIKVAGHVFDDRSTSNELNLAQKAVFARAEIEVQSIDVNSFVFERFGKPVELFLNSLGNWEYNVYSNSADHNDGEIESGGRLGGSLFYALDSLLEIVG